MKNKKLLLLGVSALVLSANIATAAVEVSSLKEINDLIKKDYHYQDSTFTLKGDENNEIHSPLNDTFYGSNRGVIESNGVTLIKENSEGNITARFIDNDDNRVIQSKLNIRNINFENGHVVDSYNALGGAFISRGSTQGDGDTARIGDLIGDFTKNYVISQNNMAFGGAIYQSDSSIDNLQGNFNENYAESVTGFAFGGACSLYQSPIPRDL